LDAPNARSLALVYVSPQGTTRKAGRAIASFLADLGYATTEYDLARADAETRRISKRYEVQSTEYYL
jgi:hypothetical protein